MADVYSPYSHNFTDVFLVGRESNEDRQSGLACARLRGYIFGGKSARREEKLLDDILYFDLYIFNSQAAKVTKYANYQKICDCIFVVFTILWIVTRIGVYPFWIIYRYVCEYVYI